MSNSNISDKSGINKNLKPKKPKKSAKRSSLSLHKWRNVLQAVGARFLLCCHGWMGVCLASYVNELYLNMITLSFLLFVVETGIILHKRSGIEWNRICTPFLIYLLTVIPTFWVLKLNPEFLDSYRHPDNTTKGTNTTADMGGFLPNIASMSSLEEQVMTDILQQSMMFVLILCRWLLPRGQIDRNSLSQLLIMYSAIGADILDFSEILTEDLVMADTRFRYVVLGIWSWSLLQFTLVVTKNTTSRRSVFKFAVESAYSVLTSKIIGNSEVLSILMVMSMQDGPFLFARCYAIIHLKMYQYLTIFFSVKNILVLVLGVYRLVVVCGCVQDGEKREQDIEEEESADTLRSLDESMSCPDLKASCDQQEQN